MQATATTIARLPLRARESVERPTPENSQITINSRLRVVGRPASDSGSWLFTIFVLAVLYIGWSGRSEGHITAESGLGYAFGIVGGSLILVLLLYPLRKRILYMHRWFPVRHWFRLHMIFGVPGPVMILLRSNFKLGSTNSSVALVLMLLVATSDLVGRFFARKFTRLFSLWHVVHLPLFLMLLISGIVHVVAVHMYCGVTYRFRTTLPPVSRHLLLPSEFGPPRVSELC